MIGLVFVGSVPSVTEALGIILVFVFAVGNDIMNAWQILRLSKKFDGQIPSVTMVTSVVI